MACRDHLAAVEMHSFWFLSSMVKLFSEPVKAKDWSHLEASA
jgi:hypothetical protein